MVHFLGCEPSRSATGAGTPTLALLYPSNYLTYQMPGALSLLPASTSERVSPCGTWKAMPVKLDPEPVARVRRLGIGRVSSVPGGNT